MPAGYGNGDHRLFIINLHTPFLIGPGPQRDRCAAWTWLNTCLPHIIKKYTEKLEENLQWHRLIEKLGEAHLESRNKVGAQEKNSSEEQNFDLAKLIFIRVWYVYADQINLI